MNVAFEPWIPVVTLEGKPKLASLCEVLAEGHMLADLAVRPHERVALMRLFLCVAHAALDGPKDYDEWCEVPKRLPDAVRKYLETWKDSFELFHPTKPWLQIPNLSGNNKSPVSLMDFEIATGNNSMLFDHFGAEGARATDEWRLPLNLLVFQNFGPGGGAPIASWGQITTKQVGNPEAPCLSQEMIHSLIRRNGLTETVIANLPSYDSILHLYGVQDSNLSCIGVPVWVNFPETPDSNTAAAKNAVETYLGRLVPISRWVKILPNKSEMYCGNGFKYATYKDGFPQEPTASIRVVRRRGEDGNLEEVREVARANPMRAFWRDLPALISKGTAQGGRGPLSLMNYGEFDSLDLMVCAITKNQASMDLAIESTYSVAPSLREHARIYEAEVEYAQEVSESLIYAVESYRKVVDWDWEKRVERTNPKDRKKLKNRLSQSASLSYWTSVEHQLRLLYLHIDCIGTEGAIPSRDSWRNMLWQSASDAYTSVCGQETPRQIKAFTEGWKKLHSRPKEQGETSKKKGAKK